MEDAIDDPVASTPASTPAPAARHAAPSNNTPPASTSSPTNTNNITTNTTNTTTQPSAQNSNLSPTRTTQHRTSNQPQETLFNVPDLNIAQSANTAAYRQHVLKLHKEMTGGDVTDYFESRIALPRSLQGLKTGHVIARLIANNPTLDAEKWSCVTADVVGSNLIIGTVNKVGRELIDGLGEVKVEPGRTAKVPPASKPNNLYHVEILLPYERELHVEFMEAFLQSFPSAKFISMPGKKPFGTTRRLRLYFNTTIAPREVFTKEDHTIPIREVTLPRGTAAQIIHKWQRLNQFRPPHMLNRWHQQNTPRSYAAAASPNPVPPTNAQPNPYGSSNHAAASAQPPRPMRRTGEVPAGPPSHTAMPVIRPTTNIIPPPDNTTNTPNPDQADWMSDEPFPPSHNIASQLSEQTGTPAITPLNSAPQQHNVSSHPTPSSVQPPDPKQPATNQHSSTGAKALTAPSQIPTIPSSTRKTNSIPKPSTQPTPPPTTQPDNTNSNLSTPSDTTNTEPKQWQTVRRSRSRSSSHPTQPAANPNLRKSASRIRRAKQSNKFGPLDFEIIPSFEDDEISPIELTLHEKPIRPPRRKHKPSKKAITKQAAEALTHPQQVRHPANSLQHLSPKQTQVVLRSKDPAMGPQRDNLIRQIALLRAARTNTNQRNITLDPIADEAFIQQVQSRLADCDDPPNCDHTTSIDVPLSSILDRDESRVRRNVCYAWMDLASRAILPHLYDAWPDPPSWNGTTLNWLPSTDGETPCLHDEALACLAACPSLHNVWTHIATSTPELQAAIRTTATQWQMFNAEQNTLGTNTPTPSNNK